MAGLTGDPIYIPTPDPSKLTMEQIDRVQGNIIDKLDYKLQALRELMDEKFHGIDMRLNERRERIEHQILATREMTDAQRKASEIAIGKSEAATSREIEGLKELLAANGRDFTTQINNLAERVGRMDAGDRAVKESRAENHMTIGSIMGIIGGCVGVIALLYTLMNGNSTRSEDDLKIRMNALSNQVSILTQSLNATPPQK